MKTNSDKRTILIVDDTPANIQVAHNILKDTYIIKIATSGAAALEVAKMFPQPDLIRVLSVSLRDVGWTRSLGSNSRWEAAGNEPKTDGVGSGADRANSSGNWRSIAEAGRGGQSCRRRFGMRRRSWLASMV